MEIRVKFFRQLMHAALLGLLFFASGAVSWAIMVRGGAGFTASGTGGSIGAVVAYQTPSQRTSTYSGGLVIAETFYNAGPRATVAVPGDDGRTFKYKRLALEREEHTAGVWAGWEVKLLQDGRGRLGSIRVDSPTGGYRVFNCFYAGYSRVNGLNGGIVAAYTRGNLGQVTRLERKSPAAADARVTTTWGYQPDGGTNAGLLAGVQNTVLGGQTYSYSFTDFDKRRYKNRGAIPGVSWTGLTYDAADQLTGGQVQPGRTLAYRYNARGNRESQGPVSAPEVVLTPNGLDQITARNLNSRCRTEGRKNS